MSLQVGIGKGFRARLLWVLWCFRPRMAINLALARVAGGAER